MIPRSEGTATGNGLAAVSTSEVAALRMDCALRLRRRELRPGRDERLGGEDVFIVSDVYVPLQENVA